MKIRTQTPIINNKQSWWTPKRLSIQSDQYTPSISNHPPMSNNTNSSREDLTPTFNNSSTNHNINNLQCRSTQTHCPNHNLINNRSIRVDSNNQWIRASAARARYKTSNQWSKVATSNKISSSNNSSKVARFKTSSKYLCKVMSRVPTSNKCKAHFNSSRWCNNANQLVSSSRVPISCSKTLTSSNNSNRRIR